MDSTLFVVVYAVSYEGLRMKGLPPSAGPSVGRPSSPFYPTQLWSTSAPGPAAAAYQQQRSVSNNVREAPWREIGAKPCLDNGSLLSEADAEAEAVLLQRKTSATSSSARGKSSSRFGIEHTERSVEHRRCPRHVMKLATRKFKEKSFLRTCNMKIYI